MSTLEAAEARERALVLLYEAESRTANVADVVASEVVAPPAMAVDLALGVEAGTPRYDALISSKARGWRLERMPMIDRAILRLALHELCERPDTHNTTVKRVP